MLFILCTILIIYGIVSTALLYYNKKSLGDYEKCNKLCYDEIESMCDSIDIESIEWENNTKELNIYLSMICDKVKKVFLEIKNRPITHFSFKCRHNEDDYNRSNTNNCCNHGPVPLDKFYQPANVTSSVPYYSTSNNRVDSQDNHELFNQCLTNHKNISTSTEEKFSTPRTNNKKTLSGLANNDRFNDVNNYCQGTNGSHFGETLNSEINKSIDHLNDQPKNIYSIYLPLKKDCDGKCKDLYKNFDRKHLESNNKQKPSSFEIHNYNIRSGDGGTCGCILNDVIRKFNDPNSAKNNSTKSLNINYFNIYTGTFYKNTSIFRCSCRISNRKIKCCHVKVSILNSYINNMIVKILKLKNKFSTHQRIDASTQTEQIEEKLNEYEADLCTDTSEMGDEQDTMNDLEDGFVLVYDDDGLPKKHRIGELVKDEKPQGIDTKIDKQQVLLDAEPDTVGGSSYKVDDKEGTSNCNKEFSQTTPFNLNFKSEVERCKEEDHKHTESKLDRKRFFENKDVRAQSTPLNNKNVYDAEAIEQQTKNPITSLDKSCQTDFLDSAALMKDGAERRSHDVSSTPVSFIDSLLEDYSSDYRASPSNNDSSSIESTYEPVNSELDHLEMPVDMIDNDKCMEGSKNKGPLNKSSEILKNKENQKNLEDKSTNTDFLNETKPKFVKKVSFNLDKIDEYTQTDKPSEDPIKNKCNDINNNEGIDLEQDGNTYFFDYDSTNLNVQAKEDDQTKFDLPGYQEKIKGFETYIEELDVLLNEIQSKNNSLVTENRKLKNELDRLNQIFEEKEISFRDKSFYDEAINLFVEISLRTTDFLKDLSEYFLSGNDRDVNKMKLIRLLHGHNIVNTEINKMRLKYIGSDPSLKYLFESFGNFCIYKDLVSQVEQASQIMIR